MRRVWREGEGKTTLSPAYLKHGWPLLLGLRRVDDARGPTAGISGRLINTPAAIDVDRQGRRPIRVNARR